MSGAGVPPPLAGLGRLDAWRRGVVVAFDDERGLGQIAESGGAAVGFHCVAIADGSRTIPLHTRVRFRLALGPTGELEARAIIPE